MPSKRSRLATEARSKPANSTRKGARATVVIDRPAAPLVSLPARATLEAMAAAAPAPEHDATPIAPKPATLSELSMPTHRLFWAWYAAGVDTVRFAFDVQSAFVTQLFEVTPASLAYQYHHAFHDRALA